MFIRENETLYLRSWEYNAAKVINELAAIVKSNGSTTKAGTKGFIVNRHLTSDIRDVSEKIKSVTEVIYNTEVAAERGQARAEYVANLHRQLDEMNAVDNTPVLVEYTTYISFVMNDLYYYYQFNENPFFEFYYQKTPISAGTTDRDACLMEDKKEWTADILFSYKATDTDIKEAANILYNFLMAAPVSVIRRDRKDNGKDHRKKIDM